MASPAPVRITYSRPPSSDAISGDDPGIPPDGTSATEERAQPDESSETLTQELPSRISDVLSGPTGGAEDPEHGEEQEKETKTTPAQEAFPSLSPSGRHEEINVLIWEVLQVVRMERPGPAQNAIAFIQDFADEMKKDEEADMEEERRNRTQEGVETRPAAPKDDKLERIAKSRRL